MFKTKRFRSAFLSFAELYEIEPGQPMKRILCVAYGGGHAKMLVRVLDYLKRTYIDQIEIVTVGLTLGNHDFRRAGYEAKDFVDYLDPASDAPALAVGEHLAKEMHSNNVGIRYEASVAYLGLSMFDLIQRIGEKEAWRFFRSAKRLALCPVSILERIFEKEQPDLLLTTNSPRAERAALVVARRLGIPSVRVEDLFGVPTLIPYLKAELGNQQDIDKVILPVEPSRIAIINEFAREVFVDMRELESIQIEPEHVYATGQPIFDDAIRNRQTLTQEGCRRELEISCDRRVFLWASDLLSPDRAIFEALIRTFAKRPDLYLIVKLHPGASAAEVAYYQERCLPNMRVTDRGNIHQYLIAANAVLTHFSTVGIETAAIGRPWLLVNFENQLDLLSEPLLRMNYKEFMYPFRHFASTVVTNLECLEESVDAVMSDSFVTPKDPTPFFQDGRSAQRIGDLLMELSR